MDIKKCKYRLRCEMGACGKRAEYTIQPARVGIRSSVHICSDCLDSIIKEGGKVLLTAKKSADALDAPDAAAVKAKGKGKGKAAASGGAVVTTAAAVAAEVNGEV